MAPRRKLQADEILAAISQAAGDGFCRQDQLRQRFPAVSSRDFGRALRRAVNDGEVLARPARGHTYLAVAAEGWARLRGGEEAA